MEAALRSNGGYPAQPVRIVEPFGRGGGPDVIATALAGKLSALWGQVVTVEKVLSPRREIVADLLD